jgi:hypothetical protein
MSNPTNLRLSANERELINNTQWILTKHDLIKKVYDLFGRVSEEMKKEVTRHYHLFPEDVRHRGGKISKGENYQMLPYVLLDYPASFLKKNIFAVRTMFWWGNFFSITLHLSGVHQEKFCNSGASLFPFLKANDFFICINEHEWQHHFNEHNYVPAKNITQLNFEEIAKQDFFKVAKKLPLTEWDNAHDFIVEGFKKIIELLQISYRGDKKDPLPGSPITGSGL